MTDTLPDTLTEIRAKHVRTPEGPDDYCTGCAELWPCDTAKALAHIDTLTAAGQHMHGVLTSMVNADQRRPIGDYISAINQALDEWEPHDA